MEGKNQGGSYVDTFMPQWYESSHITAIVQDQNGGDANSRPTDPLRLGKFCLQISHLERCYTEKFRNKPDNDIIALNLHRFLVRNAVWPTENQLKTMTMVYEDLFKGRSVKEAKLCCMHRVPGARFERSLCVPSIRRA